MRRPRPGGRGPVRVFNDLGEVRCVLAWTAPCGRDRRCPRGSGAGTENGSTANALAPDTLTDLGAGACFNDARVQVERQTERAHQP